jgi:serine protease Do
MGRGDLRILGRQTYEDFIQTDAAINPGNSGGPLVNLDGRVVGINTAIVTGSRANAGVGFAIPIDMAANLADRLIKNGKINRALLGIGLQPLTPALAKQFGLKPGTRGILIAEVLPDSPAAKAGLKAGDVITKFDNVSASSVSSFRNRVSTSDVGKPYELAYLRDGEEKTASIVLAPAEQITSRLTRREPPAEEPKPAEPAKANLNDFGLGVQELTPELAEKFGQSKSTKGLVITEVKEDSPAEAAGLEPGLLVTKVVRDQKPQPLSGLKDFQDQAAKADELTLYVQSPQGAGRFVILTKPKTTK